MWTKRQQSRPLGFNNTVLLKALTVLNIESIVYPGQANKCLPYLFCRAITSMACYEEKSHSCKILQVTWTHTRILLLHPLSYRLSPLSSLSSLSSFLCSWKRVISIIICDCFSCLCCLSNRNRCALMISRHSCKCQRILSHKTHEHTQANLHAPTLLLLHFAFQLLLKCHKHEHIYNRR